MKKHQKSAERKKYLTHLVSSLQKSPSKDLIRHLGHFAYDQKNHETLQSLCILKLLQSLLIPNPSPQNDLILGAISNLSSTPSTHSEIDIIHLISFWPFLSIHGHRSISLILYNLRIQVPDLTSPDKQTQNILILAQERFQKQEARN